MIGTGIFTSLGFQLADIPISWVIILLWIIGAILAFTGAACYAELGAKLTRSGGEYHFLRETLHPALGFVAGWVSATVGFAGPVALAAMTFAAYLSGSFPFLPEMPLAIGILCVVTLFHVISLSHSSRFQRLFTAIKLLLILLFIICGFVLVPESQLTHLIPQREELHWILTPGFAVSLIYVSYAYTGWNAATYLIGEMEDPKKVLPRALSLGTLAVAILYIGLNLVFMHVAPVQSLAGKIEIGFVAAEYIWGNTGARMVGGLLAILLISTISAMVFAGPRVLGVMGEDYRLFAGLAKVNRKGIPARAVLTQSAISLIFIISGTFESVLIFAGFSLGLTSLFTVAGLMRMNYSNPDNKPPWRSRWYPWTAWIYIGFMFWTLIFLLIDQPLESLAGLGLMLLGWLIYELSRKREKNDFRPH